MAETALQHGADSLPSAEHHQLVVRITAETLAAGTYSIEKRHAREGGGPTFRDLDKTAHYQIPAGRAGLRGIDTEFVKQV